MSKLHKRTAKEQLPGKARNQTTNSTGVTNLSFITKVTKGESITRDSETSEKIMQK